MKKSSAHSSLLPWTAQIRQDNLMILKSAELYGTEVKRPLSIGARLAKQGPSIDWESANFDDICPSNHMNGVLHSKEFKPI